MTERGSTMANFCKNCGAPLEQGALFCEKCGAGTEVNTGNVPPPPEQSAYQSQPQGQYAPPMQQPAYQPQGQYAPTTESPVYQQAQPAYQQQQYQQAQPAYQQQPQYQQPPAGYVPPPASYTPAQPPSDPQKKKKRLLLIIIIAIAAVVAIVVLAAIGSSDAPDIADTPDAPITGGTDDPKAPPFTPGNPDIPDTPDAPDSPDTPDNPDGPDLPGNNDADPSVPTDAEIEAAYKKAEEAFNWFTFDNLPLAPDTKTYNGNVYQRVDFPGVTTSDELIDYLCTIFAPNIAAGLVSASLMEGRYADIDGVLYGQAAGGGIGPNVGNTSAEIIRNDDSYITYRVTTEVLDEETFSEVVDHKVFNLSYKKFNGVWVWAWFENVYNVY